MLHKAVTHGAFFMGKTPYLFRRKNIYYFRIRIPLEHQETLKNREIVHSLKTENRAEAIPKALKLAANFKALLQDLKAGKRQNICRSDLVAGTNNPETTQKKQTASEPPSPVGFKQIAFSATPVEKSNVPLLATVVGDFLKRYDPSAKVMLGKLNATLPIFVELLGNKPADEILQANINQFFDDAQRLPVRRDSKEFSGLPIRKIIEANTGPTISEKTFKSTYRACVSVFLNWAEVHYKDQGFPALSVDGAVYRGERGDGINKQRAATSEELQKLFNNPKMKKYAANPETEHYFWLPALGLYTGARINELCQLNPTEDIKQDLATGIWYFNITDESESAEGVDKSIKTNSSRRVVPIHSKLIDAGFLDYAERVKRGGHKILFPAWQPRNGKASANAGKWFVRYLESIGLRSEEKGARLSGFHMFRHGFVTHGMNNKISRTFEVTGHEVGEVDGVKLSAVARGYWTRDIADNIKGLKAAVEQFDFGVAFYRLDL